MIYAFDGEDALDAWKKKLSRFTSTKDKFAAHCELIQPKIDEAYPRVEKTINDAKAKAKACSEYLLNL